MMNQERICSLCNLKSKDPLMMREHISGELHCLYCRAEKSKSTTQFK